MQTFLPFADFPMSARCLDNKRLNKQITEGYQILSALLKGRYKQPGDRPIGWINHPAVKMWEGYEQALFKYIEACHKEWQRRPRPAMLSVSKEHWSWKKTFLVLYPFIQKEPLIYPNWLTNQELRDRVTISHQSNLLRKDFSYYSKSLQPFTGGILPPDNFPYYWPSNSEAELRPV
jgi:hypothetical protein